MLLTAIACLVLASQDQPPIQIPPFPNIPEEAYTVWSEEGGNPVEISVKYSFEKLGKLNYEYYCRRTCIGKKHMDHKNCDSSCDSTCIYAGSHEIYISPTGNFNTFDAASGKRREDFSSAMGQFGVPNNTPGIAEALDQVSAELIKKFPSIDPIRRRCFNDTPCSARDISFEFEKYKVFREVQFLRREGNTVVNGPVVKHEICDIDYPTGKSKIGPAFIQCRCSIVAIDGEGNPIKEALPEHGAVPIKGDPNVGHACSTTELEQNNLAFICEDMNKGTFQCTSTPASMENFTLPAGTLLQPEKEAVQWMMLIGEAVYRGDGSISGSFLEPAEQVRISCTEIAKKEPDPKVKFRIRQNPDIQLVKIAQACAKERSKGPWTQGRVWIATDAAKYAEIEKVMLPAPGKRNYVEGMFQCATIAEYDFVHGKHKRCLEPAQIGWGAVTQEANLWLITTLTRADTEALAAFVSKTPAGHDALFSNARSQSDCAPAAALANSLLGSNSKKAREAGFTFLMKGVPEAKRTEFITNGGVGRAAMMLCGTDKASAEEAMKVAEAYGGNGFELALRNIHSSMPEGLKKRASELLKEGDFR